MKLCDKTQELISGYLDNELTQQDSQMVRVHIESCDNCKSIYQDLYAIKKATSELDYRTTEAEKIHKLLQEPTAKNFSVIGWTLLIIGLIGLMIFQAFTFFFSDEVPVIIKLLAFAIEAGALALFISVLRQRLIAQKTDKYKKVQL
ncbi:zf-HC2 domain-containing protein [Kangiella sp. HZ709]|uniref:zf-HC2 domain-containing protein n=1 Tax=Kangiella sp. HZ709 TaxID=2666328 RepID=UPI0012AF7B62|nr:zf-HC2 domain-containing protein [Kangiella sp. HZ709]MRX27651.1 anti-sigma factor [Kangiella sp. HZ709]